MFFCDKCRYLYNVTKDIKSKQIGGKINSALTNIFDKYQQNEKLKESDLEKIQPNDLLHDDRFENMTKKEQRKMMTWIRSANRNFFVEEEQSETAIGTNIAYFICKKCKNTKPIKPGTVIYYKSYGTNGTTESEDYQYAVNDPTLFRTRNYVCKNTKCETRKNPDIKEAVLTKNAMEQVVYICTVCHTHWTSSV